MVEVNNTIYVTSFIQSKDQLLMYNACLCWKLYGANYATLLLFVNFFHIFKNAGFFKAY